MLLAARPPSPEAWRRLCSEPYGGAASISLFRAETHFQRVASLPSGAEHISISSLNYAHLNKLTVQERSPQRAGVTAVIGDCKRETVHECEGFRTRRFSPLRFHHDLRAVNQCGSAEAERVPL